MCPEKERYQRVVQKRMSPYECDANGVMVHELTIKDYSRSAADQVSIISFCYYFIVLIVFLCGKGKKEWRTSEEELDMDAEI